MNENAAQESQTCLWTLMRRMRQTVTPIEGVSRSAARVLVTVARQVDDADGVVVVSLTSPGPSGSASAVGRLPRQMTAGRAMLVPLPRCDGPLIGSATAPRYR